MNKKLAFLVLLIFGCVSAALFAQVSIGLGGNFTADFNSYILTKDAIDRGGKAENYNSHLVGGGIYALLDVTYVEANIGFLFGNAKGDKPSEHEGNGTDITALKLGLFGKYPVVLGTGGVTFFPMLGIDGQIWLAGKMDGRDVNSSDGKELMGKIFNQFWIKGGAGFDVPIAERVYFRAEALYGIRFYTVWEQDYELKPERVPSSWDDRGNVNGYTEVKRYDAIIGHGLDIRLAIGYKF